VFIICKQKNSLAANPSNKSTHTGSIKLDNRLRHLAYPSLTALPKHLLHSGYLSSESQVKWTLIGRASLSEGTLTLLVFMHENAAYGSKD
jgi:hypothetical protein